MARGARRKKETIYVEANNFRRSLDAIQRALLFTILIPGKFID